MMCMYSSSVRPGVGFAFCGAEAGGKAGFSISLEGVVVGLSRFVDFC